MREARVESGYPSKWEPPKNNSLIHFRLHVDRIIKSELHLGL